MRATAWRCIAALLIILLFTAKFFVLGPVTQISREDIAAQTAGFLSAATGGEARQSRQSMRADVQQFEFHLPDCPSPYIALQALVMEDPQATIDAAQPLPPGLEPHVIYLGNEHAFTDRIGLKVTAISKFVAFRLGLSPERPAGYLYIVLAAPGCTGYQKLDWWKAWA